MALHCLTRKLIDDDESTMMILVTNSDTKEGVEASDDVLTTLRQSAVGLDIVRTARINVRQEDAVMIFDKDMAARVSLGTLLAFHVTGKII